MERAELEQALQPYVEMLDKMLGKRAEVQPTKAVYRSFAQEEHRAEWESVYGMCEEYVRNLNKVGMLSNITADIAQTVAMFIQIEYSRSKHEREDHRRSEE